MSATLLTRLKALGPDLLRRSRPAPTGKPLALMIDHRFPDPTRDSGSMDTINYITWLQDAGYGVYFLSLSEHTRQWRRVRHAEEAGARVVTLTEAPDLEAWLRKEAARFDLMFLSRVSHGGRYSDLLRQYAPKAVQIFNTVDLHHLRETRQAELSGDSAAMAAAAQTRTLELDLVAKTDATIVVSDHEAALLRREVPGATVWVMPLFRPVAAHVAAFEDRKGIGFVAGFAHPPNQDAIRFFLDEVWPLVHKADPDLTFSIVGMGLPEEIAQSLPEGAQYLGHVKDLEAWLATLRLTVAPLRYGSGAKGKVASSLSNGVPVAGTPIAFEGMNLPPEAVHATQDPEAMAQIVTMLHADQAAWMAASAAGHGFACEALSLEAGARRFAGFFAEISAKQST